METRKIIVRDPSTPRLRLARPGLALSQIPAVTPRAPNEEGSCSFLICCCRCACWFGRGEGCVRLSTRSSTVHTMAAPLAAAPAPAAAAPPMPAPAAPVAPAVPAAPVASSARSIKKQRKDAVKANGTKDEILKCNADYEERLQKLRDKGKSGRSVVLPPNTTHTLRSDPPRPVPHELC